MNQFEERVLSDLAELKAHMRWLVGGGNEGKVAELELRVKRQESVTQRLGGIGAALAVLITLTHVALDYLRMAHR